MWSCGLSARQCRAYRSVSPPGPGPVGGDRLAAVAEWTALPDHVSVNFHEDGAEELAAALLSRGISIDAGLFTTTDGADRLLESGLGGDCRYLLVEVTDPTEAGLMVADQVLARLEELGRPALLHGEESATWAVLSEAVRRGLATRIGLEDVLVLPDASPARNTADLVRSAIDLGAQTSGHSHSCGSGGSLRPPRWSPPRPQLRAGLGPGLVASGWLRAGGQQRAAYRSWTPAWVVGVHRDAGDRAQEG